MENDIVKWDFQQIFQINKSWFAIDEGISRTINQECINTIMIKTAAWSTHSRIHRAILGSGTYSSGAATLTIPNGK